MSDAEEGVTRFLDLTGQPQAGLERRPAARRLVRCPDCGSIRYASEHPHSPLVQPGGEMRDCAGRRL